MSSSDFEFRRSQDLESQLASEKFELASYIKEVACSYDSIPELKQHKRRIATVAEQTAQKLKHNVYKNYELFIDTSKEISSLEAEMYQLSHFLHEHESLTQSLQTLSLLVDKTGPQATSEGSKHEKLSISALLETVEGGSIVTEVPGRYLIHSGHLVELDQETFEPVNLVRAFLLNDSLMIGAHIRKRRGPVRYKFQALYELDNMAIVDVKDSDTVRFAFKILMFPDSHLYQAENESSKQGWLYLLESTKQKHKKDLEVAKLEAARQANRQMMEDSFGATARTSLESGDSTEYLLSISDWLKDIPESLDVSVAQRDFEKAVSLIERTKALLKDSSDSFANRDVRVKVEHRINKLVGILTKELEISPSGSLRGGPRAARRAVGLLLRLGRSDKACSLFLENFRQIIQRDLKDVKMEGTVTLYVSNYASTFFNGLGNVAQEFERAFGDNDGSYSSLVLWCDNQLREFHKQTSPEIFKPDCPLSVITECMSDILKTCDGLQEIGLDLGFALIGLFYPQLSQALSDSRDQIHQQCATSGTAERWTPLDLSDDKAQLAALQLRMESVGIKDFKNLIHEGSLVDLSQTTVHFCKLVFSFTNDVLRIYTPEIFKEFIDCFCDIFHNMMDIFTDALARDENIPMTESITKDAMFVIDTVLVAIINKIDSETGLEIPDLRDLHSNLYHKLEKSSREATPASQTSEGPRPAEPYISDGEGTDQEGAELSDVDDDDIV